MKSYILILLSIVTLLTGQNKLIAAVVTSPYEMPVDCNETDRGCQRRGGMSLSGYSGIITGNFQKNVNIVTPSGQNALQNFNIQKDSGFTLDIGSTTGAWVVSGGKQDTPPMDGISYIVASGYKNDPLWDGSERKRLEETFWSLKVNKPVDVGNVSIVSDNPDIVQCTGFSCLAKENGSTKIRVRFNNDNTLDNYGPFYKKSIRVYGDDMIRSSSGRVSYHYTWVPVYTDTGFGYTDAYGARSRFERRTSGKGVGVISDTPTYQTYDQVQLDMIAKNMKLDETNYSSAKNSRNFVAYSFNEIVYDVNVTTSNTPQTTTCAGATNISTSTATVNWTYADGDNDLQSNYQVQIATNPTFDTASIFDSILAPANTDVSNIRSVNVSGLSQNTNYYSRVRTYNNTNGWSEYSGCVNGFLTTYDTTNTVCGCEGRDSVCRTSGNIISTASNAPQCQFDTACDVSNNASGNTIFRIIPINGIGNSAGNIEYIKDSVTSLIIKSNSYVYSTLTTAAIQSITVIAKDLFDNQTKTRTCSIDNTITPTDEPPTIKLEKTPRITLNKNGTCKISWDIQNISAPSVCRITGKSGNIDLTTDSQGSYISGPLTSNTRFTLTCSEGELTSPVSESVICRVNPEIREN